MKNNMMKPRELNVKVGDKVSVQGNKGIVTEVLKAIDTEWKGKEYVEVPGSESISVRVHFSGELANYGQYQDGMYGGYVVVN